MSRDNYPAEISAAGHYIGEWVCDPLNAEKLSTIINDCLGRYEQQRTDRVNFLGVPCFDQSEEPVRSEPGPLGILSQGLDGAVSAVKTTVNYARLLSTKAIDATLSDRAGSVLQFFGSRIDGRNAQIAFLHIVRLSGGWASPTVSRTSLNAMVFCSVVEEVVSYKDPAGKVLPREASIDEQERKSAFALFCRLYESGDIQPVVDPDLAMKIFVGFESYSGVLALSRDLRKLRERKGFTEEQGGRTYSDGLAATGHYVGRWVCDSQNADALSRIIQECFRDYNQNRTDRVNLLGVPIFEQSQGGESEGVENESSAGPLDVLSQGLDVAVSAAKAALNHARLFSAKTLDATLSNRAESVSRLFNSRVDEENAQTVFLHIGRLPGGWVSPGVSRASLNVMVLCTVLRYVVDYENRVRKVTSQEENLDEVERRTAFSEFCSLLVSGKIDPLFVPNLAKMIFIAAESYPGFLHLSRKLTDEEWECVRKEEPTRLTL